MLHPRQFPGHLDVNAWFLAIDNTGTPLILTPPKAGPKVQLPIDGGIAFGNQLTDLQRWAWFPGESRGRASSIGIVSTLDG